MSRLWNNELIDNVQHLIYQPAARRTATFAGTAFGFTIVELLIVIVVIGILGSIVIVAYNGIQNNANDTAVKSDLAANFKILHLEAAKTGSFPTSLNASMGLKYSKKAYDTSLNNAYFCATSTGSDVALAGRSKSKKGYVYGSKNGLEEVTLSWSNANACITAGLAGTDARGAGHDQSGGTGWQAWTN